MKIKVQLGKDIPALETIENVYYTISSWMKFHDVTSGNFTLYLSLYDNDGESIDIINKDGQTVNLLFRKTPYKRKVKNVISLGQLIRVYRGKFDGEKQDIEYDIKEYAREYADGKLKLDEFIELVNRSYIVEPSIIKKEDGTTGWEYYENIEDNSLINVYQILENTD